LFSVHNASNNSRLMVHRF